MDNFQQNDNNLISVKDWIIMFLITVIPIVGFVMLFIWAFGKEPNQTKKNYAKAILLMCAIALGVSLIFSFLIKSLFG